MEDILCKCGHPKSVHEENERLKDYMCLVKGKMTTPIDCPCYSYIPDNLLTIEKLAKERRLI